MAVLKILFLFLLFVAPLKPIFCDTLVRTTNLSGNVQLTTLQVFTTNPTREFGNRDNVMEDTETTPETIVKNQHRHAALTDIGTKRPTDGEGPLLMDVFNSTSGTLPDRVTEKPVGEILEGNVATMQLDSINDSDEDISTTTGRVRMNDSEMVTTEVLEKTTEDIEDLSSFMQLDDEFLSRFGNGSNDSDELEQYMSSLLEKLYPEVANEEQDYIYSDEDQVVESTTMQYFDATKKWYNEAAESTIVSEVHTEATHKQTKEANAESTTQTHNSEINKTSHRLINAESTTLDYDSYDDETVGTTQEIIKTTTAGFKNTENAEEVTNLDENTSSDNWKMISINEDEIAEEPQIVTIHEVSTTEYFDISQSEAFRDDFTTSPPVSTTNVHPTYPRTAANDKILFNIDSTEAMKYSRDLSTSTQSTQQLSTLNPNFDFTEFTTLQQDETTSTEREEIVPDQMPQLSNVDETEDSTTAIKTMESVIPTSEGTVENIYKIDTNNLDADILIENKQTPEITTNDSAEDVEKKVDTSTTTAKNALVSTTNNLIPRTEAEFTRDENSQRTTFPNSTPIEDENATVVHVDQIEISTTEVSTSTAYVQNNFFSMEGIINVFNSFINSTLQMDKSVESTETVYEDEMSKEAEEEQSEDDKKLEQDYNLEDIINQVILDKISDDLNQQDKTLEDNDDDDDVLNEVTFEDIMKEASITTKPSLRSGKNSNIKDANVMSAEMLSTETKSQPQIHTTIFGRSVRFSVKIIENNTTHFVPPDALVLFNTPDAVNITWKSSAPNTNNSLQIVKEHLARLAIVKGAQMHIYKTALAPRTQNKFGDVDTELISFNDDVRVYFSSHGFHEYIEFSNDGIAAAVTGGCVGFLLFLAIVYVVVRKYKAKIRNFKPNSPVPV